MLDIAALMGLEWAYDLVEERYGRAAAWVVTITLAGAMIAALVAILVAIF